MKDKDITQQYNSLYYSVKTTAFVLRINKTRLWWTNESIQLQQCTFSDTSLVHSLAVAHCGMVKGIGGQNIEQCCHITVPLPSKEWVPPVSSEHILPNHVHHSLDIIYTIDELDTVTTDWSFFLTSMLFSNTISSSTALLLYLNHTLATHWTETWDHNHEE